MTQYEQHLNKRRQLLFMKQLHQDGKEITMSKHHKKLLQVDDFIQKAIKTDYNDCGLLSDRDYKVPADPEQSTLVGQCRQQLKRFMKSMDRNKFDDVEYHQKAFLIQETIKHYLKSQHTYVGLPSPKNHKSQPQISRMFSKDEYRNTDRSKKIVIDRVTKNNNIKTSVENTTRNGDGRKMEITQD